MYTDYSIKVIEHFMDPRNVGVPANYNGEGQYGDVKCGDSLTIYINVIDNIIEDIGFLVFGCTAAVATSSMVTEMARGKSLEEAKSITEKQLIEALDGLPESKLHCSVLGVKALRAALENYEENKQA